MTFVNLKKRSRSPGFELSLRHALVLMCSKFGEDTSKIFQIMSENNFPYAFTLNDLCDLENKVKVTQFELGLLLALVLLCFKFGEDTSTISPDI